MIITYSANLIFPHGAIVPAISYNAVTHVSTFLTSRVAKDSDGLTINNEYSVLTSGLEIAVGELWERSIAYVIEGRARLDIFRRQGGFTERIAAILEGGLMMAKEFRETPMTGNDQFELIAGLLSFGKDYTYVGGLIEARFLATASGLVMTTETQQLLEVTNVS